MCLFEFIFECLSHLLFHAFIWLDDSEEKLWWNTKSQNGINICSHYLKMDERLEQFLEVVFADLHLGDLCCSKILLKLGFQSLIFFVLNNIVVKLLCLHSVLFEKSNVLCGLFSHNSDSPKLIAICICIIQVFCTLWDNTWHRNINIMLIQSLLNLSINNFLFFAFVFHILMGHVNFSRLSFHPHLLVGLIMIQKQLLINILEFINFLFWQNDEHSSHCGFWIIGIDEILCAYFAFIDEHFKISLHEIFT